MNFQQVCLTALAFSSSHGGSLERCPPGQQQFVSIRPLQGPPSELVVERDLVEDGAWGVRLMRRHHRLLQAPIHYPPVRTQEALLDALVGAWSQLASKPPAPFLTRFLELFNSEDVRERDYLKTTLHRVYVSHRRWLGC
jgi:hypothetical protein